MAVETGAVGTGANAKAGAAARPRATRSGAEL